MSRYAISFEGTDVRVHVNDDTLADPLVHALLTLWRYGYSETTMRGVPDFDMRISTLEALDLVSCGDLTDAGDRFARMYTEAHL